MNKVKEFATKHKEELIVGGLVALNAFVWYKCGRMDERNMLAKGLIGMALTGESAPMHCGNVDYVVSVTKKQ